MVKVVNFFFLSDRHRKLVLFVKSILRRNHTYTGISSRQERCHKKVNPVSGRNVPLKQFYFFVNMFSTINQKTNETTRADDRFHF